MSGIGVRAANILLELRKSADLVVTHFHIDGESGTLSRDDVVIAQVKKWPGILGSKTITWIRLGYLLRRHLVDFDIVHASNQTLSFIRPRVSFVVTVHDIIELADPQSGFARFVAKYLYRGIRQAGMIVAVSEFTKQELVSRLGIDENTIRVSHNGVGSEFAQIENFAASIGYLSLRRELRLAPHDKVVLYVGSDHPRKNVVGAMRAFAAASASVPQLVFVKIGAPGLAAGRVTTLDAIESLGIRNSVRIIDTVSDSRLNELYNLADVLLFPSQYEGFGLPPLQAMAAGTPVVTTKATSLPEVVGEAALVCSVGDDECLRVSLETILQDSAVARKLQQAGLTQAKKFTWQQAAKVVEDSYVELSAVVRPTSSI